jgi:riboflavin synthase
MFTGLIRHLGKIVSITHETTMQLAVNISNHTHKVHIGDSIAINGICLTVVKILDLIYYFDIMKETVECTTVKTFQINDTVHVEFACTQDALLDGHAVLGHVMTTATCINIQEQTDSTHVVAFCAKDGDPIHKDCIAIDGVSLTVVKRDLANGIFQVCIIPHTWKHTLFHRYKIGTEVNVEYNLRDMIKQKESTQSIVWNDCPQTIMENLMKYACNIPYAPYPNPYVGCAVFKDSQLVALGKHKENPDCKDHAEVCCCNTYHGDLSECTVYVTLEPCVKFAGKTTESCAELLVKRGAKKVVVGMLDVDERVRGKGVNYMRENGVEVIILDCPCVKDICKEYIMHRHYKKCNVIGKLAITLDGCFFLGKDKYISSKEALEDVHVLRSRVQGILTTNRTVMIDSPRLNCRAYGKERDMPVYVLEREKERWHESFVKGISVRDIPEDAVNLLCECGPTMMRKLMKEEVCNQLYLYIDSQVSSAPQKIDLQKFLDGFVCKEIKVFGTTVRYLFVRL